MRSYLSCKSIVFNTILKGSPFLSEKNNPFILKVHSLGLDALLTIYSDFPLGI
ncbi:MAG: hypothetical protein PUJ51_04910 [Clostridiales bacterium]|uniref:hypothetical protein n=1 Tax=Terrisporobacter sp. TaxID=1965305 RepID=UPI002A538C8F|nr:hypothetical protein [Terrisporobacter sp.]MDD7753829.1 hypothetical protein [Clostridiales bacterium]MDY4135098.1 hypothetical protein [Terrisporobacter sp.]